MIRLNNRWEADIRTGVVRVPGNPNLAASWIVVDDELHIPLRVPVHVARKLEKVVGASGLVRYDPSEEIGA